MVITLEFLSNLKFWDRETELEFPRWKRVICHAGNTVSTSPISTSPSAIFAVRRHLLAASPDLGLASMASSSLLWQLIFTVFSLLATVTSLEVTPSSDCAALCLGGSNGTTVDTETPGTNSSDIVCENHQYHTTGTGIKFRNCVSCLEKSEATKGPENDAAWFLCKPSPD